MSLYHTLLMFQKASDDCKTHFLVVYFFFFFFNEDVCSKSKTNLRNVEKLMKTEDAGTRSRRI